jgi:fructosamine-3-kinase
MERLPGRTLHAAYSLLSAAQRKAISREITSHVAELHRICSVGFGGVELETGNRLAKWPDYWLPRFRKVLEESRAESHLDRGFLDRVGRVAELFGPLLEVGAESTLTHYDIWSGNVMVSARGGEAHVSGYVDPPGIWADYARELSFMRMFGLADEEVLRDYSASHPIDSAFPVRVSIYNLKMHLKHISMYPEESYYRRGAESCLALIEAHLG